LENTETVAVCAALMGSQGVLAEEQPFQAEGMDFAFDDAKVASVEMSELSGAEMDETEGKGWGWVIVAIVSAIALSGDTPEEDR
jgi:hypothetical protein